MEAPIMKCPNCKQPVILETIKNAETLMLRNHWFCQEHGIVNPTRRGRVAGTKAPLRPAAGKPCEPSSPLPKAHVVGRVHLAIAPKPRRKYPTGEEYLEKYEVDKKYYSYSRLQIWASITKSGRRGPYFLILLNKSKKNIVLCRPMSYGKAEERRRQILEANRKVTMKMRYY